MPEHAIHEAALQGDLRVVRELVEKDKGLLNLPGGAAKSVPLIIAAQWGNEQVQ